MKRPANGLIAEWMCLRTGKPKEPAANEGAGPFVRSPKLEIPVQCATATIHSRAARCAAAISCSDISFASSRR